MRLRNRAGALLASTAVVLAAAFAATASAAFSQDADPAGKLSIWTGRWSYQAQTYETAYGHAYAYNGTGVCDWSYNHGFIVCDYLNHNPEPGAPVNDITIYTYDPGTKTYSQVNVFKESKPFTRHMTVAGNTWTSSTEIPYKGKTIIYRDVYVFQSSHHRTTTTQISADNGKTWTTTTKFTSQRAA
jgi:hypothetical protein